MTKRKTADDHDLQKGKQTKTGGTVQPLDGMVVSFFSAQIPNYLTDHPRKFKAII
jgi:hypothetical protein